MWKFLSITICKGLISTCEPQHILSRQTKQETAMVSGTVLPLVYMGSRERVVSLCSFKSRRSMVWKSHFWKVKWSINEVIICTIICLSKYDGPNSGLGSPSMVKVPKRWPTCDLGESFDTTSLSEDHELTNFLLSTHQIRHNTGAGPPWRTPV